MSARILFLVEGGAPPHLKGKGGYAGFIRYVDGGIADLLSRRYEVIFGTVRGRSPLHPVVEARGCTTFALGCSTSKGYPLAAIRLAKVIRHYRPDVLHLNESIQGAIGGVAGVLARQGFRIFHRHHTVIPGPTEAFSRVAGRLAHLTMAVSEASAGCAIAQGADSRRVVVAHNGVPRPRVVERAELEKVRREMQIAAGDKVVTVVGHLRPEKGHRDLLLAMESIVRPGGPRLHLVVVGGGTEESALREQALQISDLEVHFVGHQPDVAMWMQLANVVAVPSRREPFGLVAVEAMASGRPVVASNVDGLAEVVEDGVTGVLVPPGDPARLGAALTDLLSSEARANQMGESGMLRYEQFFTVSKMVDRWVDCYERRLGGLNESTEKNST